MFRINKRNNHTYLKKSNNSLVFLTKNYPGRKNNSATHIGKEMLYFFFFLSFYVSTS